MAGASSSNPMAANSAIVRMSRKPLRLVVESDIVEFISSAS
jgi:hypothetical protein